MDRYWYPEHVDEIHMYDIYEEQDIITGNWSIPRVVRKLCNSQKTIFQLLINRKGIRIKTRKDGA